MNLEADDSCVNPEDPHLLPLISTLQNATGVRTNEIIGVKEYFHVPCKILVGDVIVGGFLRVGPPLPPLLPALGGRE